MNVLNNVIQKVKGNRVVSHLVFWVTLFCLDLVKDIFIYEGKRFFTSLTNGIIYKGFTFIPEFIFSYYLAYVVISKFFAKKKYITSIILFLVGLYFIAVLSRIMVVHGIEPFVRTPPFSQESIQEIFYNVRHLLKGYIPSVLWTSLIFISIKYYFTNEKKQAQSLNLAKEKAEIELKTLKGQLNPHFLFNTLNNIYSLSIDNSPQTSESIAKLSEILDYVLYKCDPKFVLLDDEVQLLKNYIELEKLRYDERLQVHLETDIQQRIEIPPLILLSLVENAFKHGAGEDSGSPVINIRIISNPNMFRFVISNTISNGYESKNSNPIGLVNMKKQLDLIYKNQYELKIDTSESFYTVILTINQKLKNGL